MGEHGDKHAQVMQLIGAVLRQLREARSWRQVDVAERMQEKVDVGMVCRWEQGTRRMSVIRLLQWCDALNVSPLVVLAQALDKICSCGRPDD